MAENGTASGPNGDGPATNPQTDEFLKRLASTMSQPNPGNGMIPNILFMYNVPNGDAGFRLQTQAPEGCPGPSENADTRKSAIILRRTRNLDVSDKPLDVHSIIIQSPILKELLGQILEIYPSSATTNVKRLEFQERCEPLIHRWRALKKDIASTTARLQESIPGAQPELYDRFIHASTLNLVLKTEFANVELTITDFVTKGVISFPDLWILFEPGSLLLTRDHDQDVGLCLQSTESILIDEIPYFALTCSTVDFDGNRLGVRTFLTRIKAFDGTKRIVDLPIFPLEYHSKRHQIWTKLIERGRRFESLAGVHYCHYDGMASQFKRSSSAGRVDYYPLNGRVVIDALSFKNNCTQASLFNLIADLDSIQINRNPLEPMFAGDKSDASGITMHDLGVNKPEDGRTDSGHDQKRQKLTEDQILVCWPFIHGYALEQKKWLSLYVDSLSDIVFNDLAFSDLQLPHEQKELMMGLASSRESYGNRSQDPVQGKGRGVLVLLRGPPGVGKTLTAETVAETMKVPLFTLTIGDVVQDLRIEDQLVDLISMCDRWGAIILLDEINVFFSQINYGNLQRSYLVSLFLRTVEHYQGIMFLTANQVETFDPAFQSRIHISLQYPELDTQCRKAIWQTFLRRHGDSEAASRETPAPTTAQEPKSAINRALNPPPTAHSNNNQEVKKLNEKVTEAHQVSEKEIEKLARTKLDGRQIGNCFKTGQMMAIYKREALGYVHIEKAVSLTQSFQKEKEARDEAYARLFGLR